MTTIPPTSATPSSPPRLRAAGFAFTVVILFTPTMRQTDSNVVVRGIFSFCFLSPFFLYFDSCFVCVCVLDCGLLCHRNCHLLVRSWCEEVTQSSTVTATYIMAQDHYDQRRWVEGLREIRRIAAKVGGQDIGSPGTPHTPNAHRN